MKFSKEECSVVVIFFVLMAALLSSGCLTPRACSEECHEHIGKPLHMRCLRAIWTVERELDKCRGLRPRSEKELKGILDALENQGVEDI